MCGCLLSLPPLNVTQQHELAFLLTLCSEWFVLHAQDEWLAGWQLGCWASFGRCLRLNLSFAATQKIGLRSGGRKSSNLLLSRRARLACEYASVCFLGSLTVGQLTCTIIPSTGSLGWFVAKMSARVLRARLGCASNVVRWSRYR